MKDKPRIGSCNETDRIEIYNGNYAPSGVRIGDFTHPWTVIGPNVFHMLPSFEDAVKYATANQDPTPQSQEQVTAGWAPKYDHEAAWQEKQELTR